MKFFLQILTPSQIIFKDSVDMVVVPAVEGQIGILARHAPLLTILREGKINIHNNGSKKEIEIKEGFLEVSKEQVLVLVKIPNLNFLNNQKSN
jgi:F-type H+-transporting ATPase subunit epsilon